MNLLKASLSKNDLRCLFNEYVEEVTKNHFYIRTKTHEIHIKNQNPIKQPLHPLIQPKPLLERHHQVAQSSSLTVLLQSKIILI